MKKLNEERKLMIRLFMYLPFAWSDLSAGSRSETKSDLIYLPRR